MSHTINGTDSFPAGFIVPDDGESRDAAAQNVGLEALADRATYLKNRLGARWTVFHSIGGFDDATLSTQATWTDSLTPNPDVDGFTIGTLAASDFKANDILRVAMTGSIQATYSSLSVAVVGLYYKGLNGHATFSRVLGAECVFEAAASGLYVPFSVSGFVNVASVQSNPIFCIAGYGGSNITNVKLIGSWGTEYVLTRAQ